MTTHMPTLCFSCARATGPAPNDEKGRLACTAFPDGIPEAIITDGFDHRDPYPGDNGIRYELDPAEEGLLEVYENLTLPLVRESASPPVPRTTDGGPRLLDPYAPGQEDPDLLDPEDLMTEEEEAHLDTMKRLSEEANPHLSRPPS